MVLICIVKPLFEPCHEKTCFLICENKCADQLCSDRAADQHLCFRYIWCSIPVLPKSKISSILPFSVMYSLFCVRPGRNTRKQVFSQYGSFLPHIGLESLQDPLV